MSTLKGILTRHPYSVPTTSSLFNKATKDMDGTAHLVGANQAFYDEFESYRFSDDPEFRVGHTSHM